MTIQPINIRRYDVSAKRRFDEMTFQENNVASSSSAHALETRFSHAVNNVII